ncbi:MAG: YraN family protein [Pseudomonadota bacterium]
MPGPLSSKRRQAERAGRTAEFVGGLFLVLKGYRLLQSRFQSPVGEIDIVARRGSTLVFVEVKLRKTAEEARLAVTPQNQRRIKAAADTYLARKARRLDVPLRYDIIAMSPYSINHIRDAFR